MASSSVLDLADVLVLYSQFVSTVRPGNENRGGMANLTRDIVLKIEASRVTPRVTPTTLNRSVEDNECVRILSETSSSSRTRIQYLCAEQACRTVGEI